MSNTDVRVKLSLDANNAHKDIRLLDKEIQELGKGTLKTDMKSQSRPNQKETNSNKTKSSTDVHQEARDTTNKSMLKETTLIRKELQELNSGRHSSSGSGGGTTPPTSGSGGSKSPNSKDENSKNGQIASALGKVATVLASIGAASKLIRGMGVAQQQSQSSQSEAYRVYGSSLWYNDYGQARKDAHSLGINYGYNYNETMAASDANLSRAGFTTKENYETDMNSILMTSKAWGIDASSLGDASGGMVAMGAFDSGGQKKFADLLAESIVQAQMEGREDEQLRVLEQIAEGIYSKSTSVSGESLAGSLGIYTALANQNENLRGSRGADLVTTMNNVAASGNQTMLQLAGYGTDYTGLEGKQYLTQLAEENPDEFYKLIAKNIQAGKFGLTADSAYTKETLHSVGFSYSEADEILGIVNRLANGDIDLADTSRGQEATEERNRNWNKSTISNLEQYEANKMEIVSEAGDALSTAKSGFAGWWDNLSPGWKTVTGIGATVGGPLLAGQIGKKGLGWLGSKLEGTSVGSKIDDILKKFGKGSGSSSSATYSTEEVAKAFGTSVDDITASFGKSSAYSIKDIAKGLGSSTDEVSDLLSSGSKVLSHADDTASGLSSAAKGASRLSKAGKWLGAAGTALEVASTGIDVHQALKDDDKREAASELGGGVGSLAGGAAGGILGGLASGAATGALAGSVAPGVGNLIGLIIGGVAGVGGALIGNKLGETAGEKIYDVAGGDDYSFTDDQKAQIQEYANKVQELYNEKGNNAAQKYTNEVVAPYLNSLGVSKSITDKYKSDVGKPDFLKDIEKETFGDLSVSKPLSSEDESVKSTNENTLAIQANTDIMKEYLSANEEFGYKNKGEEIIDSLQGDKDSNSDIEASKGNWFSNLFKSHAVGNDYVPHDNYLASLHKGEAVLSKLEADDYRQGKTKNGKSFGSSSLDININVGGSIQGITPENQSRIVDAVVAKLNSSGLQDLISNGFIRVQNV